MDVSKGEAEELFKTAKQKELDIFKRINRFRGNSSYDLDDINSNLEAVGRSKKSVDNNFKKENFQCAKLIIKEIDRHLGMADRFLIEIEAKASKLDDKIKI